MAFWTRSPEAAALLASCAAAPPPQRCFAFRFQETETRFVGWRMRRLRRLYRMAEPAIDTPAWRTWLAWDPQRAVAEAIRRSRLRRRLQARSPAEIPAGIAASAPTLSTATAG